MSDPHSSDASTASLARAFSPWQARTARERAAIVPVTIPYSVTPAGEGKKRAGSGQPQRQLAATELRCNEIWLRAEGSKIEKINFVLLELHRRYGLALSPNEVTSALDNEGGRRYRAAMKRRVRQTALTTLGKHVPVVVKDYLWAREAAKDQGDYKETRMAAVDHLDRLGITLKKEQAPVQMQTIILRGRNFDAATLDAPTPEIETAEIVQEDPGADG